jgi:CHAT domain-containing protein
MSATVSIMALPSHPDDVNAPTQFYVLRGDIWQEVPLSNTARIGLLTVKEGVTSLLNQVMTTISQGENQNARAFLRARCHAFWNYLLPEVIREQLTVAFAQSIEPPCVLIYTHPKLEWLPWELLHDGSAFLGLRARVARLPIVPNGPASSATHRTVTRAASFLGVGVFDALADALQMDRWASTFAQAESQGVSVQRFPVNGTDNWPKLDNVAKAESCDIIHLTCHGGIDSQGTPFLTLDPTDRLANVDEYLVGSMILPETGPLIFGNACGSTGAAAVGERVSRSVAVAFFDRGAAAFVGAIAPISKALAVEFAEVFYRRLLIDGLAVGEALRSTKQYFEDTNNPDPSWLFYCLYGSPDTCFVPVHTVHAP